MRGAGVNPEKPRNLRLEGGWNEVGALFQGPPGHPGTVCGCPRPVEGPCLPHAPVAVCAPLPHLPSPSSSQTTGLSRVTTQPMGRGCGRALRARAGLTIILRGPSRGTFSRKQAQRGSLGGWGRCPSQEVLGAQPADPSRAPFNEWGSETCTAQGSCTKPRTCTPCLAQKGQKTRALCRGTPPPLAGEAPHKLPFRAEHRAESGRP